MEKELAKERAFELEMSGEAPWVPILDSPGDLPLRETSELRAAGPVLLTALHPASNSATWAAMTWWKERGVLLDLLELMHLFLQRQLVQLRPEMNEHATSYPVTSLSKSPVIIRLVGWNRLQSGDVNQLRGLFCIRL